jgi:hypothetical protein
VVVDVDTVVLTEVVVAVVVVDVVAVVVVVLVVDVVAVVVVAVVVDVVAVLVVAVVVDVVDVVDVEVVVGVVVVVVVVVRVVVVDVVVVLVVDDDVVVVVVVVVLVDDVVVVVPSNISQFVPENPGWQTQRYPPLSVARHVPSLRHGLGWQGFGTVVVVVVGPGVQVADPGGAVVPGGHAVHEVAPSAENVSDGQGRQDDEPANGLNVPGAQGMHAIAPLSSENVPAVHGVHDVAPTRGEDVPGKHITQGSMPVGLAVPGWQSCAKAEEPTSTVTQSASRIGFRASGSTMSPGRTSTEMMYVLLLTSRLAVR